jgi:hypothetical protein
LEQAAIAQLQSETIANETDIPVDDDDEERRGDFSDLQVLLHSSENFGPITVRDLTVRYPFEFLRDVCSATASCRWRYTGAAV